MSDGVAGLGRLLRTDEIRRKGNAFGRHLHMGWAREEGGGGGRS